jgi:hypothetical protein
MSFLFRLIHHISPSVGKVIQLGQILLIRRGFWRSLGQQLPQDAHGQALPWFTYPAIDYLSRLDFSRAEVLEYGAGQSSLWWAARSAKVTAVEGRPEWVQALKRRAPDHLTVLGPLAGEAYVTTPLEFGRSFDVIVVDGFQRQACAQAALPFLAEGGLLILDNADWHPAICGWLRQQGLIQIDFHGFGPLNPYTWCTAIFLRSTFCLPYLDQAWDPLVYGNLPTAS